MHRFLESNQGLKVDHFVHYHAPMNNRASRIVTTRLPASAHHILVARLTVEGTAKECQAIRHVEIERGALEICNVSA